MSQLPQLPTPPVAPAEPAPRWWLPLLAGFIIVVAGIAAYSNSLHGPFVLDDIHSITENPTIRSLRNVRAVLHPPGEGKTVQGRPVVNFTLALNHALGGENVVGYHIVNLAIHLLAGLTLLGIVRRTLLLPRLRPRFGAAATGLALAAALIWTVHPLQTESVTYVIQRTESLMGLFYLLTLYCALRGMTSAQPAGWYTAAVAACALGMGSKEVMVSAPLMVLVYDRIFVGSSWRQALRQRWPLYAGLAATWIILAALIFTSGNRGGSAGFDLDISPRAYALTQFGAIVRYLHLTFWPADLTFDYGTPVAHDPARIALDAALVALLVIGTVAAWRWRPALEFLGLWFFAILAPTSSFVPVVTQTVAEHRMYLPLAAVAVLVVIAAWVGWRKLLDTWPESPPALATWAWALPLALLVGGLGWRTWQRNEVYGNAWALWDLTCRQASDNPRAQNALGQELLARQDFAAAYDHFTAEIRLSPRLALAFYNRGITDRGLGMYSQAVSDYTQAIALESNPAQAYENRGVAYQDLGRHDLAIQNFNQVLALAPRKASCYCNRGNTYLSQRRLDLALADFSRAIEIQPRYAAFYINRGNAWGLAENYAAAAADYDQALSLPSNLPESTLRETYALLAVCRYQLKQYDRAWAEVARCRKLGGRPDPQFLRVLSEVSGKSE